MPPHPDPAARLATTVGIGVAAGLIAAFAMNRAQRLAAGAAVRSDENPATVKAAERVTRATTGAPLGEDSKPIADAIVHYGTGALIGLAYTVVAELRPEVTRGFGLPFGFATAVSFDEAALPAMGLSAPPWEFGAATHLYAVASHLVFGTVLEGSRRALRALA